MADVSDSPDGCMRRPAVKRPVVKTAAGITVFLLEELGDARSRLVQLKKYIDEATDLIEKSEHRDHFFEVAGNLIHGIPEALFKMEKALEAAAFAAARLDYEEIKEDLKPEKIEELEKALQDVRIRRPQRRSGEGPTQDDGKDQGAMNTKSAATHLSNIAKEVEASGRLPMAHIVYLIRSLETGARDKTASTVDPKKLSAHLQTIAQQVATGKTSDGKPVSRVTLARHLRRLFADMMEPTAMQQAAAIYQQANSREDVMKGFKDANPSMSEEDLEKAADNWEKHKDVVKDIHQEQQQQ